MPATNETRLITISEWNTYHPWPKPGGLRWLVFHEKTNGFNQVIRRVGRRVLIDEQKFFQWVEQQNIQSGQPIQYYNQTR